MENDGGIGYRCMYNKCKQRRLSHYDLVYHVEKDHSDPSILEKHVVRDPHGKVLALPPQCVYRYFPQTLSQYDAVDRTKHDIGDALHGIPRGNNSALPYQSLSSTGGISPNPSTFNFSSGSTIQNRPAGLLDSTNVASGITAGGVSVSGGTMLPLDPVPVATSIGGGLPRIHTICMSSGSFSHNSRVAPSPDSGRGSESSVDDTACPSPMSSAMTVSVTSQKSVVEDENSNDSYYSPEDLSVDKIVKSSKLLAESMPKDVEKRFKCPVEGCDKLYKNVNGIRYHAKNSHRVHKQFRCQCGKKYSTEDKLTAHQMTCQCDTGAGGPIRSRSVSVASQSSFLTPNSSQAQNSLPSASCLQTPMLHRMLSSPPSGSMLMSDSLAQ